MLATSGGTARSQASGFPFALRTQVASARNYVGPSGERTGRVDERDEESDGCPSRSDNHDRSDVGLRGWVSRFAHRDYTNAHQDTQTHLYRDVDSHADAHSLQHADGDEYPDANAYADEYTATDTHFYAGAANRHAYAHRYRHTGAAHQYAQAYSQAQAQADAEAHNTAQADQHPQAHVCVAWTDRQHILQLWSHSSLWPHAGQKWRAGRRYLDTLLDRWLEWRLG